MTMTGTSSKHPGIFTLHILSCIFTVALAFTCTLGAQTTFAEPADNGVQAAENGTSNETATPEAQKSAGPSKAPSAPGWMLDDDGTWYYINADSVTPRTGWLSDAGAWYYLDSEKGGAMAISRWAKDGDNWYYLTKTGAMHTGWLKSGKSWYYLSPTNGAMHTGWLLDANCWYYLNPAKGGRMVTGKCQVGDAWYALASTGALHMNGWVELIEGWHYATATGALQTGWRLDAGAWYWLIPTDGGRMAAAEWAKDGNAWYLFAANGAMATGWQQDKGKWYYLADSGVMRTGWLKDGEIWYYLQPSSGAMLANATKTIGKELYAFAGNGAMRVNCQVKLDGNVAGYAQASGVIVRIGVFDGSKVILKNVAGETLKGWQKFGETWFYGKSDGTPRTGWFKSGKSWYYLDPSGAMHTGWLKDGSKWYYLKDSGVMVTGTYKINGVSYTFDKSGAWIPVSIVKDIHNSLSHGPKDAAHQKYIVLHDTEGGGTPQNVVSGWVSNGNLVASHFVIGRDGTIVQCVPMDKIAHHAGFAYKGTNASFGITEDGRDDMRGTNALGGGYDNYAMNAWSIGIEMVHWDNVEYPKAQLKALDDLIAYIDGYYGFKSTIIDHKMWNGNSDTSAAFAGYLANYRDHRTHA